MSFVRVRVRPMSINDKHVTKDEIDTIVDYILKNPRKAVLRYQFAWWGGYDLYLFQFIYCLRLLNLNDDELRGLVSKIFSTSSSISDSSQQSSSSLVPANRNISIGSGSKAADRIMKPLKQILNRFSRKNDGAVFIHHNKHAIIDRNFN